MNERTIRTTGAELRVRLDGPDAGPLLVLANSLGTTLEMWDPQVLRLSAFCRVLRYDQRGHGGSSTPPGPYTIADLGNDLVALLDELGVERAALCGLSLGGMAATWVAAHHPGRVTSLVVASSAPVLGPPEAWHERAAAVRQGGVVSLAPVLHERWFPPQARAQRPDLLERVTTMLATCSDEGYAACCEAIAGMDLRPVLGTVTAPVLVIAGAHDPATPPPAQLAYAEETGAGLVVLPHSSHLANLTEPEAFSDAVLAHLAGGALQRGTAVRRAVLGDAHVDRSATHADPETQAFVDLLTRYAWGEIWARPGLDRRSRSVVTLTALIALGRVDELELHVSGALRNGLSAAEIGEIVLQSAIYAGVPAANSAMAVVRRALGEASDGS
jgi:3-oxoadipate enol-lactonase / 4-carboxymuconolactone decarboxylase